MRGGCDGERRVCVDGYQTGALKRCIAHDPNNSHRHRRIEFSRKQQQEWTSTAGEEESRPRSKGGGRSAFGSDGVVDDVINSGTGTLPGVRQRLMSHSWWKKGRAHHLGQRVARSNFFSLTRPPSCRANGPSSVCSHLLDQETSDMFWLSGSESGWLEGAGCGTA